MGRVARGARRGGGGALARRRAPRKEVWGACTARGGPFGAAGCYPAGSPAGVGSSAVGAPGRVHGGGTWAGRAQIALGKVGQRVPSARPSLSAARSMHSSYSGGGALGLRGAH